MKTLQWKRSVRRRSNNWRVCWAKRFQSFTITVILTSFIFIKLSKIRVILRQSDWKYSFLIVTRKDLIRHILNVPCGLCWRNVLAAVRYPEDFRRWYTCLGAQTMCSKLMKNNWENILLPQIYEDEIFTAAVFKHYKTFNFTMSLFLFFSYYVSASSYLLFEVTPSVRFIYRYWRWCFANIFRLEVVNSKNRPACFKDFLNANAFHPHTPDPTSAAAFGILLCTKRWTQTKPWICHCVGRETEKLSLPSYFSLVSNTSQKNVIYIKLGMIATCVISLKQNKPKILVVANNFW